MCIFIREESGDDDDVEEAGRTGRTGRERPLKD